MVGIYTITNAITGKFYVGSSKDIEKRWASHRYSMNSPRYPLHLSMRKHGLGKFVFEVVQECSQEDLLSAEQAWLDWAFETGKQYNLRAFAGTGHEVGHTSEETRRKMSEANKRPRTWRRRIANGSDLGYNADMSKKVVAYIRVSTEEQASCGHSLENQEARIKAYATALDLGEVYPMIDAGYSAKSLERPNMRTLMQMVAKGEVRTVIIYKLDRLTRSVVDLGRLVELFAKHDVALISVSESLDTSTASGRMFINLLGVLSQWEREIISERVTTTMGHLRTSGKVYGPTPYGYVRMTASSGEKILVVDDDQQLVLARINAMRAVDEWSFSQIADELNHQGVAARNGGKWHASSVHSVLNSRMATA